MRVTPAWPAAEGSPSRCSCYTQPNCTVLIGHRTDPETWDCDNAIVGILPAWSIEVLLATNWKRTNNAEPATGNEPAMHEQNWPTGTIAKTRWELIENEKQMLTIPKPANSIEPECCLWNQNCRNTYYSLIIIINACNACMAGCRRQSEPMLLLHAAELHGVDWAPDWPRNLRLWQCNCWNFTSMEHRTFACQKLGTNIAEQATGNEPAMQEQNLPTGIAETRWELIENEKHMLPISKITSCSKPECTLWNQNYPCSHNSLPIIVNACNACMAGCRRQSEPMLLLHAAELHGVDWAPDWPRNLRLWQCNCWNFAGMMHRTSACQKLDSAPTLLNRPLAMNLRCKNRVALTDRNCRDTAENSLRTRNTCCLSRK